MECKVKKGFISEEFEQYKRKKADIKRANEKSLRPLPHIETVEYLFKIFKVFYPKTKFDMDPVSLDVNAYASTDDVGGSEVLIKGGLLREESLEIESLALIIAHELAHCYGESEGWVCEGELDYYAVKSVLKKVWKGKMYHTLLNEALPQLAEFFEVNNSPAPTDELPDCRNHPSGECRIATFHAALNLEEIPKCAKA